MNNWTTEFLQALKAWRGSRSFLRNGGVPGYQFPSGQTPEQLAEWFQQEPEDANNSHDPRSRRNEFYSPADRDASAVVAAMRNADASYSPDW